MALATDDGDFWVGDVVETSEGHKFINYVGGEDEWSRAMLFLTEEYHPAWTGSYMGVPAQCSIRKDLRVVERGNFWRRAHNLPLQPFDCPANEAYFYFALGEAYIPKIKTDCLRTLLKKIDEGELDGYFTKEWYVYVHGVDYRGVVLKNRSIGRQLAQRTLDHDRYKVLRRKLRLMMRRALSP